MHQHFHTLSPVTIEKRLNLKIEFFWLKKAANTFEQRYQPVVSKVWIVSLLHVNQILSMVQSYKM